MQYLLTEEEYNNLVPFDRYNDIKYANQFLRNLVVPPERCVAQKPGEARKNGIVYCSQCPLGSLNLREGSTYKQAKAICDLPQEYSQ